MAIVTTSTNAVSLPGTAQDALVHFPSNGVDLLLCKVNSNDLVCRFSVDGGQNWATPLNGPIAYAGVVGTFSAVLDPAENIHVAFSEDRSILYLRGQPNTARTDYTWSAVTTIQSGGSSDYRTYSTPAIDLVKIGATIYLNFLYVYRENVPESTTEAASRVHYQRWTTTDAGGTPTFVSSITLESIVNPGNYLQRSGELTVDGNNDVHMAYGWGSNWKYARLPYGDGTWPSVGLVKEVVMTGADDGFVAQIAVSPLNVPFITAPAAGAIKVASKASGAWADISPGITGTFAQGFFEGTAFRLCYISSGVKVRRYGGGSWAPETVVNANTAITRLNVERKPTGGGIGAASQAGAASPYTIAYDRISLPSQGYHMMI